jgi:hypothetical protein
MDAAVQAVQSKAGKFIALSYADQIVPGPFEYALNEIVEGHLDPSVFLPRHGNDDTGWWAYDPKVPPEKLA